MSLKSTETQKPTLMQQILRFGVVGGLSFLIDLAVYSAIVFVFGDEKTTVAVAAFFSFMTSVTFNYIASMKYVFERDESKDRKAEFTIFVILSAIGLVLNEVIIMGVLVIYDITPFLRSGLLWDFKSIVGKIFATGIVMVYNFISRKIFIEKKN